ncbi:unnamed protein product [Candida verbasci]|uniref:TauD/TfdA-like domain-containing protein n=1 Tax=Candida verbasci TaxID=1227364 RepID=A0A9W4XC64_9ASCO|nr:unnamed protein product [Candida verbasci]
MFKQIRSIRFKSTLSISSFNNKEISLLINNKPVTFNNVFLRDSCQSLKSVDPYSKQKLFTTAEAATNLTIAKPPSIDDSKSEPLLKIQWNNNNEIIDSEYSSSWLSKFSTAEGRRIEKFFDSDKKLWGKQDIEDNMDSLTITCDDFLNKDDKFFQALFNLNKFGLVFIKDIPQPDLTKKMSELNASEWPVCKLGEKFGYIKKTFYGTLFDVKNEKEEAKNIANTNTFLPLHMDLLYYESPPGLQLLHFIQNSTLGGENIFCDSFLAAKYVFDNDLKAYKALTKIPITYHYDNNNEYYYYKRPLIIEGLEVPKDSNFPKIHAINYSPPFQGPLEVGITKDDPNYELFDDFLKGMQLFENFINDPKNHFEIKMKEGTCVIFENRRALHSRNEFSDSNGGDRWLMGTYVDGDSFRSKLRVNYRKFK